MHRETPLDYWLTVATVVSLFVPVWGILLAPSRLVAVPTYLLTIGSAAVLVVIGTLVYAWRRNRVLLNRFVVGYCGGLAGTAVIHAFIAVGFLLHLTPSLIITLGNVALGRDIGTPASALTVVIGLIYHYVLNGAAWGAAYALVLGKERWWYGAFFGMGIWAVLMVSPVFNAMQMGPLNAAYGPMIIVISLFAHLIYGGTIGFIVNRYVFPEVGMEGSKAVRPAYI